MGKEKLQNELIVTELHLGTSISAQEKPRTPEEEPTEVVVYIPGLAETTRNKGAFLKPVQEHAAQSGKEVLCFEDDDKEISNEELETMLRGQVEHARAAWQNSEAYGNGDITEEQLDHAFNAVRLGMFRRAYNFVHFLEEQQQKKNISFDQIVVHSQGAIVFSLAALLWPHYFSNVHAVLVNPAGWTRESEEKEKNEGIEASERVRDSRIKKFTNMFGEKSSRRLLAGYYTSLVASLFRGHFDIFWDSMGYMFKSTESFFARFGETKELDDIDIIPIIQILHYNAVNFSLLIGENDSLFTKERYEERFDEVPHVATHTHKGGHFALVEKPKQTVKTIQEILHT